MGKQATADYVSIEDVLPYTESADQAVAGRRRMDNVANRPGLESRYGVPEV